MAADAEPGALGERLLGQPGLPAALAEQGGKVDARGGCWTRGARRGHLHRAPPPDRTVRPCGAFCPASRLDPSGPVRRRKVINAGSVWVSRLVIAA